MTVKIQLDDKTMLASDQYQWMLQKPHKEKNGPGWRAFAFYSTLENACNAYVQGRLRDSNAESIATLRVEHENAVTGLSAALSPMSCRVQVVGQL